MVDGELCSNLGIKRDAVELMGRDMQGCIPAEGVGTMLALQQALVAEVEVAEVAAAGLVEVVPHVFVRRVQQSCGCCVCSCACSDSMDMCLVCMRRSGR